MESFGNIKSFNFGLNDDDYHSLGTQVMMIVMIVIMIMTPRTTLSVSGATGASAGQWNKELKICKKNPERPINFSFNSSETFEIEA